MGKYLITMKSMDGDEGFDQAFADGVVCDGFAIMARNEGKGATVAIHGMNIDGISDVIKGSHQLMSAAILAKAKRQIMEIAMKDEAGAKVEALKALFGGLM